MENPDNLKYTKKHEWVKVEGDTALCGVTDKGQQLLKDIVFVELPSPGPVAKDQPIGSVESVKSVSDFYAPVSGEIVELNKELENSPDLLNKEPYGRGWVVKIKLTNKDELNGLMDKAKYEEFIKA
ncbi:glycine cleavage system protein GcvH [Candidatus Woesearchaeota archaeon]|nr:glycine cleavage system protein GcvH [Candidatus Woesearchaeota archaeon]